MMIKKLENLSIPRSKKSIKSAKLRQDNRHIWGMLSQLPPTVKFAGDEYRLTILREDNGNWTVTYHSDVAKLRGDFIGFCCEPEKVFDELLKLIIEVKKMK
jgi:hypothetical protein